MGAACRPRTQSLSAEGLEICARIKAAADAPLRVLFLPGPGDVVGTFDHWRRGYDDPAIPAVAYSAMLYDVIEATGAILETWHYGPQTERITIGRYDFRPTRDPHRRGGTVQSYLDEIRYAAFVAAKARAFRPDIVFQQQHLSNFWLLGLVKPFTKRHILSVHNTFWLPGAPTTPKTRINRALNGRFWAKRADGLIAISDEVAAQAGEMAPGYDARALVHIPQYHEEYRALHRPVPHRAADGKLHSTYLGRVERDKGVFDMLAAAALLRDRGRDDLHWHYIGDGGALAALTEECDRLGMGDHVTFHGRQPGHELFRLMGESQLLICPTTSTFAEGLAKTPLEAALCGVPSVITDRVPCGAIMGDAALTVPADNPSAMADAIARLGDDAAAHRRMADATGAVAALVTDRSRSWSTAITQAFAAALDTPAQG